MMVISSCRCLWDLKPDVLIFYDAAQMPFVFAVLVYTFGHAHTHTLFKDFNVD